MFRDKVRIEKLKILQDALEKYYQIQGGYPRDGGNSWTGIRADSILSQLFDFDSFLDPCGGRVEKIYQETSDGIANCEDKEIRYHYSGIDCNLLCKSYLLKFSRETGGDQVFSHETKNK